MKSPDNTQAVLAIDAGGTKCEVMLVAADGTLLQHCRLRDADYGGRHPVIIKRAVARVLGRRTPARLVVVGMGASAHYRLLPPRLRERCLPCHVSEEMSALAAAGQPCGVVVIAGTGARAGACLRDGRTVALDALGPVLGDRGSGYSIGREALRAVAHAVQMRQPATDLRERVFRACGCGNLGELVTFSLLPRDRSLIASLARIVNEEAGAGDVTAQRLLREGARLMAGSVRDLVQLLGIGAEDYPLVGAGSVAVHSDLYWRELCRQVRIIAPRFRPQRVPVPPVAGLAAIGLRKMDAQQGPAAAQRLFARLKQEDGIWQP